MNIQAKSHEKHSVAKALEHAEEEKCKKYKQRIEEVENGTFYPVIFTTKRRRPIKSSVEADFKNSNNEETPYIPDFSGNFN